MIYHVTRKSDWEQAIKNGFYAAPSLQLEGFIHTSTAAQVPGVLERYYENEKELVLLHIDELLLTANLTYELAPSVNDLFPHVYGTINLNAITKAEDL